MQRYVFFSILWKEDINRGEGGLLSWVTQKSRKAQKFYKVSLAARDGVLCHTDSTEITDFFDHELH